MNIHYDLMKFMSSGVWRLKQGYLSPDRCAW